MKFSYFIFIFVVLQDKLIKIDGLRILDSTDFFERLAQINGNCSKTVSFMETYKSPYLETYRVRKWGIFYKTQYRWNYKIESRKSWHKVFDCCDGYKLRYIFKDSGIPQSVCEPICQPDCGNGKCIYPSKCKCNAGYTERTDETQIFGCAPACTHTCVHGNCTAPEICTCNFGYKMSDDHYTCEPVCNVPCGTGSYCSKPDQCLCLLGYRMSYSDDKLTNVCQPICERECVNGKCTAPDTCTCDDGYGPDAHDVFACEPKCEPGCLYGACTAPNVCTCNEGYQLKAPQVCKPICSQPCAMGTCVAPEICSCYAGYGLLENSKYICEPICEKACLNGRCIGPGVCTCDEGFRLSGDEREKHICEPYCKISCEPFGVCTAPDVCTCSEGYRWAEKQHARDIGQYFASSSVCEPVCDVACINGFCSAPQTCSCNRGYRLSNSNHTGVWCEPTCSQNCVNGFCSAPETCACNEGYRPGNYSNVCEPFCETDCNNGYCTAPNECTCKSGYRPSEGPSPVMSLCEPICDPSCRNGVCVQPDVCSCTPGYYHSSNSTANACDPTCHEACQINGICKAPDLCVCRDGYRMTYYDEGNNVPFECEPICGVECGNGTCTGPDHCACFDGYRNAETGGCEPACTTCDNGTCIAPEVCECNDGFVLADRNLGFLIVFENGTRNGSRCVPHCENCENGECEAPDECRCRAGFVKIKGTCIHACQAGCGTHGECVEERRTCDCDYGWTGPHCDQPTLCVLILNEEANRTEQLTIIEERNATIEHILINNPSCSECISKVNNETLCFKMLVNGTKNETQISCLMNEECLALSSQYTDHGKIIKLTSGIAGGILLLTAITIYLIVQKRRNRQMVLGGVQTICKTSMQGLVESSDNVS